jgi:hypothetical protein
MAAPLEINPLFYNSLFSMVKVKNEDVVRDVLVFRQNPTYCRVNKQAKQRVLKDL